MSHHRRSRHVLGAVVCLAVLTAATGCRRSLFHRGGGDQPLGPNGKPIGYQEPLSILDQASAVPTMKSSKSKTDATPVVKAAPSLAALKPASTPVPPPPEPPLVVPAETPMLDAALRRAEAVEAQHRRIMREEEKAKAPRPMPATAPAVSKPDEPTRDAAVRPASAEAEAVAPAVNLDKTRLWTTCAELAELLPADISAAAVPATLPKAVALLAPAPPENVAAGSTRPDEPPGLTIHTLQLCRRINRFGSYDTMDPRSLRAGKPVLIYCELSGLHYDPKDGAFVSRVGTRVELIDAGTGETVWEVLGEDEDQCQSRPRDSFVGTRITLPDAAAPGDYLIRLTQTDALAGRSATTEQAVTITR